MRLSKALIPLIMPSLLVSCKKDEPNSRTKDYLKFNLDKKERAYMDIDSTFQICAPSNLNGKFSFLTEKTFKSTDNEFYSFAVSIAKDSIDCPINKINAASNLSLTLTKKTGDVFVDFDNWNHKKLPINWSQEYYENKIVVTGKFNGWMYQHYSSRTTTSIEPALLDSIFIDTGEFQLTFR
jgi:hypothetical protein